MDLSIETQWIQAIGEEAIPIVEVDRTLGKLDLFHWQTKAKRYLDKRRLDAHEHGITVQWHGSRRRTGARLFARKSDIERMLTEVGIPVGKEEFFETMTRRQ